MLSPEGAVTCAAVQNPNSLCVTFVIVRFQQEWSQGVHCGAVWRIQKKIASDPVSKTAAVAAASKNMVHQNLVWRQLIISLTIQCHGNSAMWPPCYLRRFLSATVGMSAMWGVPIPNCSLLLCPVFIGECIGNVIKWLKQKYITEASNLTERLNSSSR